MNHQNRTVLVTGGASGIGAVLVERYAQEGAAVGFVDRDATAGNALAERLNGLGHRVRFAVADVADFDACHEAWRTIERELGPVDTLVNNAGISPKHDGVAHKVWEMDPAEWSRVIAVNLSGCFHTVRALSPAMREAGRGWIVNLSSVAGKTYSPIVACHYAASKAALIGLTKHLAAELGPFGIRVNAIAPGRIETPMVRGVGEAVNAEQARLTPMQRLGQPEEVADLALYLTSAEASFVTGQTVDVAGGLYMT